LIVCSKQQPKRHTGNSPTAQTSVSRQPRSDSISDAQPDVVYAHIEQHSQPASANDDLYENVAPKNDLQTTEAVIYSELQNKDTAARAVAPSGDLYAEVQKR